MPVISVVVPAHNIEEYIAKCLTSIIEQTFKDFEAIIVENGSDDLTFDVSKKYAEADNRFKIIRAEKASVSNARNEGIKAATGQYITFIDGDDFVSPDYFSEFAKALKEKPDSDLIILPVWLYYSQTNIKPCGRLFAKNLTAERQKEAFFVESYLHGKFVKSSVIKDNNVFFDISLFYGEDLFFITEIKLLSRLICLHESGGYYYTQNRQGQVTKERKSIACLEQQFISLRKCMKLYEKYGKYEEFRLFWEKLWACSIIGRDFAATAFAKITKKEANDIFALFPVKIEDITTDDSLCTRWQVKWFRYFKFWHKRGKGYEFLKFMRYYRNIVLQPLGVKYKDE